VGRFDDVFWIRTTHRIPLTVWGFCGIYVHTQSYRYLWKLCRATSESVVRHLKVSCDIWKCRATSESVVRHLKVSYDKK
jgi:hypothetical protein